MALIKRGGQLFEDTDDTLMNRVKKLGTSTPTSPKGADGIGASPDSAKMMGAGAQRKNALKQAVAPKEQTLAGQQRLQGAAEATDAHRAAQERAQQLQSLGAMGTRVQSQIEARFAGAEQAAQDRGLTAGIQADVAGIQSALGYTPEQLAADQQGPNVVGQIQGMVNQYMELPSPELLKQMVGLGLTEAQVYQMTGLTETGEQATARTIADAAAGSMTMQELNVEELGYGSLQELSDVMGVDVSQMTVPEFQAALEDLQGAEYDRLEEIRAELRGLPAGSARREMLMQEAAALGDVGMTGAEQMVEQAVQDIDLAQEVTIGGESYNIEELLSDEGVSDLIEQYLRADEDEREEMFPEETFGELREWITENQATLSEIMEGAGDTQADFKAANESWDAMETTLGMNPDMMVAMGWNPDSTMTSDDIEAWIADNDLGGEFGFGSMYVRNEDGTLELREDVSEITANDVTDENKDIIAGMSAEQIQQSHNMTDEIEGNSVLADLVGIDDTSANFLSAEQMQSYQQWEETSNALRDTGLDEAYFKNEDLRNAIKAQPPVIDADWISWAASGDDQILLAIQDPLALELITSGNITAENREELLAGWEKKKTAFLDRQRKDAEYLEMEGNLNGLLDSIYPDTDVNPQDIEDNLAKWKMLSKMGVEGAAEKVSLFERLSNPESLLAELRKGGNLMDFLQGTQAPSWKPHRNDLFPKQLDEKSRPIFEADKDGDGIVSTSEMTPTLIERLTMSGNDVDKLIKKGVLDSKTLNHISSVATKQALGDVEKFASTLMNPDKAPKFWSTDMTEYENNYSTAKSRLELARQSNPYKKGTYAYKRFNSGLEDKIEKLDKQYKEHTTSVTQARSFISDKKAMSQMMWAGIQASKRGEPWDIGDAVDSLIKSNRKKYGRMSNAHIEELKKQLRKDLTHSMQKKW